MGSSATVPQEGAKSGHSLRRVGAILRKSRGSSMPETRKLVAILAADIVGFSRLAGADEEGTLARLRALRSELINPTIADHLGASSSAPETGLSLSSAALLTRCAAPSRCNRRRRASVGFPPERLMAFRIGIHVGDVVEEADGDLMGEGVNIAARIEGVCEPGGVAVSEDAWRQAEGRSQRRRSTRACRASRTSHGRCVSIA